MNESRIVVLQQDAILERIKFAITSSIFGRLFGVVLQFAAIPICIGILGINAYASYIATVAVAAIPAVVVLRHGPAFSSQIAEYFAKGSISQIRSLLWSGLFLVNFSALISAVFSVALIWVTIRLEGSNIALIPSAVSDNTGILCYLILLNLFGACLTPFEEIQAGFHENHLLNLRSILANTVILLLLFLVFPSFPSQFCLATCLFIPHLVTRCLNACFLLNRFPAIGLFSEMRIDYRAYLPFVFDGVAFTVIAGFAAYLCHQLPLVLIAAYCTSEEMVATAVILQIILLAFSGVSLLTVPFITANRHAFSAGNLEWLAKYHRRLLMAVSIYGIGFGIVFTLGAKWLLAFFTQTQFPKLGILSFGGSIYLVCLGLEYCYFTQTISIADNRRRSVVYGLYCIRALLTAIATWICCRVYHPEVIFFTSSFFAVFICVVPYSQILNQIISNRPIINGDSLS